MIPKNITVKCKHCGSPVVTSKDPVDKITICIRCSKQFIVKAKKRGK